MAITVIRHSERKTQGETHVAMVVTQLVPFEAIFQMYTVFREGRCTLDIEEKYSTEEKAVARFNAVTA